MRGFTMRTGRFTHCYICSFLCVLRARLEQTNYVMITQGGKKQRKSISLESWETASRITTDYLSNWRCVPTITALWPSLDQPSLLQHPSAPPTIVRSADPLSQIGRPTNIGVATSRPPCYAILKAQMHYSVHVFLYPTNVQKDFTFRQSYITPPKTWPIFLLGLHQVLWPGGRPPPADYHHWLAIMNLLCHQLLVNPDPIAPHCSRASLTVVRNRKGAESGLPHCQK